VILVERELDLAVLIEGRGEGAEFGCDAEGDRGVLHVRVVVLGVVLVAVAVSRRSHLC
jgi:hypothetical protein